MDYLPDFVQHEIANEHIPSKHELQAIAKKAYMDATYQFLKTCFLREHVRAFAEDGVLPVVPKDPRLLNSLNNQMDRLTSKPPYLFITINPRTIVTFAELDKVVKKVVKKKTIKEYAYVYEVRKGETGLHCHLLVHYEDRPHNFKRGVKNTCKNICDANNNNILNFKFVNIENLQSKMDYISGIKKTSKMPGVKDTISWRKLNNILPIYHSIPPLSCRDTQNLPVNPPELLTIASEDTCSKKTECMTST